VEARDSVAPRRWWNMRLRWRKVHGGRWQG
jgi:hypothetical protein